MPKTLTESALAKLAELVADGDCSAVKMVIDRTYPALKPQTPTGTLDGQLLILKIRSLGEVEDRLAALEQAIGRD